MAEIIFNRIGVDSFKVFIPIVEVKFLGKFNQEYLQTKVFLETGELEEILNRDTKTYSEQKGIKVKLEVVFIKFGNVNQKENKGEPYLAFQPSAKFLKENYFDGINAQNLPTIYNYLMSLKIVWFSYESFLNARFKDVDFCINFESTVDEFKLMTKNVEFNVLEELKHFVKPFNKYLGLQFNERKFATPTRPFVKFYHKSIELFNNSNEFYCEYLNTNYSEVLEKGIGRYEITVKDAAFKKHYKIESMTVEELFNVPYESIEKMFKRFLPNYLYKSTREKKMGNTPTEIIHSNCINQFVYDGKSEQEIIHLMLKGIDERSSRNRSKKLLQELLNQVQEPQKLIENNEQKKGRNEFYKTIGFYEEEKEEEI
jgi:hypothetical protein